MSSAIKRVAIIAKPKLKMGAEVITQLQDWLRTRGIESILEKETGAIVKQQGMAKSKVLAHCDLIVVLGGDGTLLSVARLVGTHRLPILAVNFGSLGFLTEITLKDMFPTLELVLKGTATVQRRMMIDVTVIRKGKHFADYRALNDVVLTKAVLARIIDIDVRIDKHFVATYKADGLIVGTPTGSTAYTLSAGGPILYPSLGAMLVTPIASHTLTFRSLVVPDSSTIEMSLKATQESVFLTIDGQTGLDLQGKDRILVSKSASVVQLIECPGQSFFDILRRKLKWGER